PRELVAVEQALKVRIGQVEITGRVDRLESDEGGPGGGRQLETRGAERGGGPRGRRRPEDRRQRAARGRTRPAPAARRLPAGGAARRVRAVRPGRAGWRGARPGRQGGRGDA